MIQSKVKDAN